MAEPAVAASRPSLAERVPPGGTTDPDLVLDAFLGWVADIGFELYPAQEEALLEIMAGRHVILSTPTGSGKSLVAQGLHFKALCEGRRSFYSSPIKALASEKFFSLCHDFGPENVGMLTGDAAINGGAPIVCCTAEVVSNMALREGEDLDAPYVVMDEFHYYADPERGVAWQIPLITLPRTRFLLMSATLGDMAEIAGHLKQQTDSDVALVTSVERPVPLTFDYRETALHETVGFLLEKGRAPVYVVSFTQRECAEKAQALTSAQVATREQRDQILEAIRGFRFDTAYGKEFRRFLSFGIGVHHAGLLPKYRLLVEQLSQQGLLKVICGTDTLGVGVNIPIRTVLFSGLAKYDGQKFGILSVRDFKQIAGRAGRKGFDDQGWVVCQAPDHIVEKKKAEAKAASDAKAAKKLKKAKFTAPKGRVSWTEETFESLISRPPETLKSQFRLDHGMILNLIQRDAERDDPDADNFASLRRLVSRCHEDDGTKKKLLAEAALLVRSLHRARVLRMAPDETSDYLWVVVNENLQWDFSMLHALSLYLVQTLEFLKPDSPTYALEVVSLSEAILEDPHAVLRKQLDKLKRDLLLELKADGVPYEERIERLDEMAHPKPMETFLYATFDEFRRFQPWVAGQNIRPKSIGREMVETYASFGDYVKKYGLQRSEGVLLRYLSQLYKVLAQTVPDDLKTEEVWDIQGYFRAMLQRVDTSLLEEWEGLLDPEQHPELEEAESPEERDELLQRIKAMELLHDPKAFAARVRGEVHQLVRALSRQDWEEAASCVARPAAGAAVGDERLEVWEPERFEAALAPYFEEYGELLFTPEARHSQWTRIVPTGERTWEVTQVLLDPEGDNLWHLAGTIDLTDTRGIEGPLLRLREMGP